MYSILPAFVSALFLGYGLYVIADKGFTRIGASFFALCITTFFWQAAWAFLFQIRDPDIAIVFIKFGYLLILFLPTSLYHFLVEISGQPKERPHVYTSYGVAAVLSAFLIGSDLFVAGYYDYFWGYYPKAGPLHPMHVLQTIVVVSRGLYITYRQQRLGTQNRRSRLRLCITGLLIYFFAAVDYLCNYGLEFYPPGVVFIAISLGIIAVAIVKYDLMTPMSMAATVAHEIRTPLLTIRMQVMAMTKSWPALFKGYQLAVQHGLCEPAIRPIALDRLSDLSIDIAHEIDRSNTVIDMVLASATMEQLDTRSYDNHSFEKCLAEALRRYPFCSNEREKLRIATLHNFNFYGSDVLLVYVLFNLLKNGLYALNAAGRGEIVLSTARHQTYNRVIFTDTGTGIPQDALPHIFDAFFTTKKSGGTGIGLAFCRQVMLSFGGQVHCESVPQQYTTFILDFPSIGSDDNSRETEPTMRRTAVDTVW